MTIPLEHPYPMPTAEEILGGETQAGVPRPSFSFGEAASQAPARRGVWARLRAALGKVL